MLFDGRGAQGFKLDLLIALYASTRCKRVHITALPETVEFQPMGKVEIQPKNWGFPDSYPVSSGPFDVLTMVMLERPLI